MIGRIREAVRTTERSIGILRFERIRDRGVEPQRTQVETGHELADLTIVFTGSVEGWNRDDFEDLVERGSCDGERLRKY